MKTTRSEILRLASEHPDQRKMLVSLLRRASSPNGDPNVALASVRLNAERSFLQDVVMLVIRYSAKKTAVQGKSGGYTEQRGVVTGFIVDRSGPEDKGLMVQARVKKSKIVVILSDLNEGSKQRFVFADHETPASIAADLSYYGRNYIMGEPTSHP